MVYHVLNRANGRLRLLKKDDDCVAFEAVLAEVHERAPIPCKEDERGIRG
jgi:hypothetical protein